MSSILNIRLKGLIASMYLDYKGLIRVTTIIAIAISIGGSASFLLTAIVGGGYVSNASMINVYTMTGIVSMIVMGIICSTNVYLRGKFAFPTNKKSLAVAQGIMMAYGGLMICAIGMIMASVELMIYRVFAWIAPNFMVISKVTLDNYFVGMIGVYFNMILIGAFIYCVFMFIRRWMIGTLVVIALLTGVMIAWATSGATITVADAFVSMFYSKHIVLVGIKLTLWYIAFHGLAFIPLMKREVA